MLTNILKHLANGNIRIGTQIAALAYRHEECPINSSLRDEISSNEKVYTRLFNFTTNATLRRHNKHCVVRGQYMRKSDAPIETIVIPKPVTPNFIQAAFISNVRGMREKETINYHEFIERVANNIADEYDYCFEDQVRPGPMLVDSKTRGIRVLMYDHKYVDYANLFEEFFLIKEANPGVTGIDLYQMYCNQWFRVNLDRFENVK